MHIIIIGCGLAGLTVSIALAKAGHTVEIIEAAADISYIGAGIQISPNSSRILRKLGVDKYIEKYCTDPVDLRMMRWQNGQILVECPLKEPAHNDYKSPYWHIHRADLHRGLLEAATELGCKIYLDSRVVKIDPYKPSMTTKNGDTYTADLIVASDGLHSMAREVVMDKPGPPVPTGQMVYRVTLPAKKLQGIPELEELITVPRNNHWIGPHGTILSYLLEGVNETLINFVFTCDVTMAEGVNQKIGNSAEVRERFKSWDPRIGKMLEYVDEVLEWRLYTHEEIPSWVHPSLKLCLIGDAAHAMTPYLAQGAAMGIEDSAILAGLLEKYPSKETLPKVLMAYQRLRIKRAAKVATASISSRYFTQMPDGEKQRERDEYLLSHPGIWKGHMNIRSRQEFLDELFGYDAYAQLEEYFAEQDGQKEEEEISKNVGMEQSSLQSLSLTA
ncbi:FAD/NAD(P)-binding domain-containing protein [Gymnopus androsaceus JB14]|uniref:FAD/NAD(P)-binding domain-containing protein n=1 Tax=Gymnopus androsaceus JB14 TaxID=1447944 RepID=A0A6A4HUP8_9AGAR|nr:FAD/NAD(P)-binding domain-containing protein [Gymnopus androsaceus JB14]